MNNLYLPCIQGCSLNDECVDSKTLVRELIFTYKCSEKCGECHILNVRNRSMSADIAAKAAEEGVAYALNNGYKKIIFHLIGSNVLEEFDTLKEFYKCVQRLRAQITIHVTADTCGKNLTDDKKQWLLDTKGVFLWLKWTDFVESEWDKDDDFWHQMTDRVILNFNKKNFPNIVENVRKIKASILPEYTKVGRLEREDYITYLQRIKYLAKNNILVGTVTLSEFSCLCSLTESENKQIEAVDVDGKRYHCKYMSPLHCTNSTYERLYKKTDIPVSCGDCELNNVCKLCPAAILLKTDTQCNLLKWQYAAMQAVKKSADA